MSPSQPAIDVTRLIDASPWTGYQKFLISLVALTIVFDGIDNQLLGIALPSLMIEWSLPRSAFALVITLGYVGMMIGGAVAGIIGDRIGRRDALLGSVALFGAMTIAAAFVDSPDALGVFRFLAGLGLGGAMPNAAALAAEYVPARRRPLAVTIAIVCVPVGGTIAGLLGLRALPQIGWRMVFVAGGVAPLVAAIAFRGLLRESPQFLARRPARWPELRRMLERMGHRIPAQSSFSDPDASASAARAPVMALFRSGLRGDTAALWGAYFSCMLAVYLGFAWLTVLLTGAGFDGATANAGITVFNLGGVAGAFAGAAAIARFGSRLSMLAMASIAVGAAAVLSVMPLTPRGSAFALIAMLTVIGAAINAVQIMLYALATHVYSTDIRATGVGSAVSFGRIGAVLSGFVGAWVIDLGGARSYFAAVGTLMLASAIAIAVVRRHVARSGADHHAPQPMPYRSGNIDAS